MSRMIGLLMATTIALVLPGVGAAKPTPRLSAEAAIADNGDLVATFSEKGLGAAPVDYRLQASYRAVYTCAGVFWGLISGGGPSWNEPSQTTTLTPVHKKVAGTLAHPTAPTTTLSLCPSGPIVLAYNSWTNVTVTDTTNGVVVVLPDINRSFSPCPGCPI